MLKKFLKTNLTNYNENEIIFIYSKINDSILKKYIEMLKIEYVEKIIDCNVEMLIDNDYDENNLYFKLTFNYFNYFCKKNMIDEYYFIVDCEWDVIEQQNNFIVFERYFELLKKQNEYLKIDDIVFNVL